MSLHKGIYVQDKDPQGVSCIPTRAAREKLEQFFGQAPQRAATAHAAQAIHLSQKIFGIDPAGSGVSLLFIR